MANLIGKTIATATVMKLPQFDDSGWLRLTFTDGTSTIIVASYGSYTGNSMDEYPTCIYQLEGNELCYNSGYTVDKLIPV